jgi:hypothetical protein
VPEPQTERRKHEDDADVCDQPLPEVVPEEQDIHAHHNGYQSKHVERDGGVPSHRSSSYVLAVLAIFCRIVRSEDEEELLGRSASSLTLGYANP